MKPFGSSALVFLFLAPLALLAASKDYVTGHLQGQAGNHFFQVAVTSALAWDNGADPFFPQLGALPTEYRHYFSRFKVFPPSHEVTCEWVEPSFRYTPIKYQPGMKLIGYFQSWKYFAHYRDRLIALFAPTQSDLRYIQKKYGFINDPDVVGIQLRYYFEDPYTFPQYGKDYLEKAMALFPDTSLFVVSSNRIEFAKSQISTAGKRVVFLENESDYIEFYLLTLCSHNIISNSTFGWWSAFLNQNPNQIVVCPSFWSAYDTTDLCPDSWIKIEADRIDPTLVK